MLSNIFLVSLSISKCTVCRDLQVPQCCPLLALPAPSLTRRALGKAKSIGIKEGGDGSPPLSPSMRRKVRARGGKERVLRSVSYNVCILSRDQAVPHSQMHPRSGQQVESRSKMTYSSRADYSNFMYNHWYPVVMCR